MRRPSLDVTQSSSNRPTSRHLVPERDKSPNDLLNFRELAAWLGVNISRVIDFNAPLTITEQNCCHLIGSAAAHITNFIADISSVPSDELTQAEKDTRDASWMDFDLAKAEREGRLANASNRVN